MARGAASQAQQTYRMGRNLENQSMANANALYNQLTPAYTNMAVNPQGINPQDRARMYTEAQQGAGGSMAAATGRAQQLAAANRNTGSFAPVLGESARGAARDLSQTGLGIGLADVGLKESQRQAGLEGLSGLQAEQNKDVLGSLGLMNEATQARTAASPGWFQNMTSLLAALKPKGNYDSSSGDWSVGAGGSNT